MYLNHIGMTLKDSLIAVSTEFARARSLSISRVSKLAFGDGGLLNRLQNGGGITTDRFELSMKWFSANWPEGAVWPEDVSRPEVSPEPQANEAAA